ncbi:MAG TPA: NAD(+)/NADH kinase [Candidatus Kapabacteria bacterium]|jgi:NAD+ kinase|nr:NAD(+)/NADH kinase [Candidatus Kapabacteria bacterium]
MNRIGIVGNQERSNTRETLVLLLQKLEALFPGRKFALSEEMAGLGLTTDCEVYRSLYDLVRHCDIIFSIGGDGTMLMVSRAIQRANPAANLIGVNVGKLGFLSEHPPEEIGALLEELTTNTLVIESRLMIGANLASETGHPITVNRDNLDTTREGTTAADVILCALNEVVIDNYGSTRMLTLEVFIDSALLGTIRADGIMISTPTGSTGYAISAGGPIVEPTSAIMLITPIAPHSLNVRPIIVPEASIIRVRATSEEANPVLVVADGQEQIIVPTPALIMVRAAQHRLQLLRRKERSYFDLLRSKLYWSADQRDVRK